MMSKTIGFIGGGNMAEGIIKGILTSESLKKEQIFVQEILPARQQYLKEQYDIQLTKSLKEIADQAEILVLATRPQDAEKVTRELAEVLTKNHILVSICAGLQIEKLSSWTKGIVRWARIMPNTMIESRHGYSALTFEDGFSEDEKKEVQLITDAIGKTLLIPENQFDAFTATSCAGPEWLILFSAALVDAAVETGLSRKDAYAIVTENLVATGLVLGSTTKHPYQITDEMNTPGGIGIEGFHSFQRAGLHGITMDAVKAAFERTQALGK